LEVLSNKLNKEEEIKAAQIIASAFSDDPVMNAIFKNMDEIGYFMHYITKYLNIYGEIHHTDDFSAAALWVPPHSKFLTLGLIFKNKTLLFDFFKLIPKISIISLIRLITISDYLDKNHPVKSHYYLFAIGVAKEKRRKGIGGDLLNYAFSKFGADAAYYLENSNIENMSFYKRHGFSLVAAGEYRKAKIFFMTKNIS
jgi:ribosomal protein S18 acetylase RimI-like enzyme